MDPAALELVYRIAQAVGLNPAVILVGYLLVRELREWRRSLDAIGKGLGDVGSGLQNVTRGVVQHLVHPEARHG
jgi:hypothetical protein